MSRPTLSILTGPTATGKSGLAIEFAEHARAHGTPLELINADSLIVYRELDIGTAKPTPEELARVPHHLVNIRDPRDVYTAGDFRRDVEQKLEEIHSRGARALVVGGTGFYLKALTHGLWGAPKSPPELRTELEKRDNAALFSDLQNKDPESATRIGPNDRYRLIRALEIIQTTGFTVAELEKSHQPNPVAPYRLLLIDRDPRELEERIHQRTRQMLDAGLLQETEKALKKHGEVRPLQSVGYAQCLDYLQSRTIAGRKVRPGLDGLFDEVCLATRQLVKRQRTWFRGLENAERCILPGNKASLWRALEACYLENHRTDPP